jgi:transcriptional regulator with XRE-family HTH domain
MNSTNEKIGHLIAQIRQERGLTQAEFAKLLSTSQSAVNRMEHGRQNLSLETLGRISDVLNKQLISLGSGAVNLRIEGGHELHGEITLKTSKNAAVGLLCASLLNYGVTRFTHFPRIEEVYRIIEVLESIGVQIKWTDGNTLEIRRPVQLKLENLDAEAARKTRSVLMMMGPLMHDYPSFKIPYAGGCKLGARTVAPHLYALEEFGVDIEATSRTGRIIRSWRYCNRKCPVCRGTYARRYYYRIRDYQLHGAGCCILLAQTRCQGRIRPRHFHEDYRRTEDQKKYYLFACRRPYRGHVLYISGNCYQFQHYHPARAYLVHEP